ncbi:hypothetical protein [Actinomadura sp. WMMB 499]|uniref:hypothetical protein n=1 Tax=Actinomadura sp. WMMB 499 TaxID=1219491 RepID=UPI001247A939|nr:hypothetical protein [Actinomadura sp. WMMB 499]QFG23031.1 hypothetical protein F7P10_19800 [Actinomadura sp. WMMB 499]
MAASESERMAAAGVAYGLLLLGGLLITALSILGMFICAKGWATAYGTIGTPGTVTITHSKAAPRGLYCYGDFRSDRGARTPDVRVEHSGSCTQGRQVPVHLVGETAYVATQWNWWRFVSTVLFTVSFLLFGLMTFHFGVEFVGSISKYRRRAE